MRLLIVDDHEVVREGLVATLSTLDWLTVIGAVATGREALELIAEDPPRITIIDLKLPDMSGEDLCRELVARLPEISVVILSSYLSEETVTRALSAGACAYVTKAAGIPKLKEVLDDLRVTPGKRVPVQRSPQVVEELDRIVANRQGPMRVSWRQERILELAAQGLTNRLIGNHLFISESTVRFHLQNMKEQMGARTRSELVGKAIRLGIIAPAAEDVEPSSSHGCS